MNYDKLSILNLELGATGESLVSALDDGSDEFNVCGPAYDAAVDLTIERHDWNFGTQIAPLQRVGNSPDDEYTDAYAMPQGAMSIVWVRLSNAGIDQSCDYKIINDQICLNSNQMTPLVKFVVNPGVQNWPPLFVAVIRLHVRAAIYRGLKEDDAGGDAQELKAEKMLQEARTRVDQNAPKRAMFNGRAVTARRVRRPWINTPAQWSGTDAPD